VPRHVENLGLGLWTAPDPAKLENGQLSYLRNGVYLPGSQALQRARGRAQFGAVTANGASATATDVLGLRDIQFDNGDHHLVAMISGTATGNGFYRYAPVADTGTFATLASAFVAGTQLEVVHYRNRFFLFNGATAASTSATAVNSNLVVYLSATGAGTTPSSRQHGMLPVASTPIVTSTAGTFSQTVTGYYEYWTTEVATSTQDGADFSMESTFNGTPATIWVTSVSMVPLIQRPDIVNTAVATHWRVYRSPKKDKQTDKKFPTGFMIGSDISIAATSMQDSQTVANTGAIFPANFNGVADAATVYKDMTNPSRLTADDNSDATMAISGGLIGIKKQGVYGFNFGGFTGPVQGIEVTLEALVNTGTSSVSVTLARGRQTDGSWVPHVSDYVPAQNLAAQTITKANTASKAFTATTSRTVYTLGGPFDRWFPGDQIPFRDSDFTASGFMLVIGLASPTNVTLSVDYVTVKVYYGGSTDTTIVFPTVAYTFGDIVAQVGKNGAPPSSSTGDLYEDALVVNDASNSALIRYSVPGDPESFPPTYFLDFETRDNDNVTCIKTVNSRLVIGLQTAVFRANYLPSERDASFDRGKAIEPISRSYGIVNPMCAAVFSRDGGSETLAFVSDHGIHGTDGFSFDTYTDGLDWSQIISRTGTSNAIALINDRDRQELLFYFRNDDNTNETYLCLHLSYANDHWQGGPKISGPVHVRNFLSAGSLRASVTSAWTARRTSGAQDVFLGYGGVSTGAGSGYVYRESGSTIPSQDDTLKYATRRMFLADEGSEWKLSEVYGFCGGYGSTTPTISYQLNNAKTDSVTATGSSKSTTLAGQPLHKVVFNSMCEGVVITATITASAFAQHNLILDGEGWGLEDSGK